MANMFDDQNFTSHWSTVLAWDSLWSYRLENSAFTKLYTIPYGGGDFRLVAC
jgi:hypothetical protein